MCPRTTVRDALAFPLRQRRRSLIERNSRDDEQQRASRRMNVRVLLSSSRYQIIPVHGEANRGSMKDRVIALFDLIALDDLAKDYYFLISFPPHRACNRSVIAPEPASDGPPARLSHPADAVTLNVINGRHPVRSRPSGEREIRIVDPYGDRRRRVCRDATPRKTGPATVAALRPYIVRRRNAIYAVGSTTT